MMTRAPGQSSTPSRVLSYLGRLLVLSLCFTDVASYTALSDDFLRRIPSGAASFDIHNYNQSLLAPLLIPRVPGTPGHTEVQHHLAGFFRRELPNWTLEWQNSTSKTPATGDADIPFCNLILRRQPLWTPDAQASLLTLTAHYDSKLEPTGFVGATDSAAPVAMLMHVARTIEEHIQRRYDRIVAAGGPPEEGEAVRMNNGVQILLLDGEEAFVKWTAMDSLYGARALAAAWEDEPNLSKFPFRNRLSQVSLFVLLDLLGSASPHVPSYFINTHWAYRAVSTLETRLRAFGLMESRPNTPSGLFLPDADKPAFRFKSRSYVQDDHVPFMTRGIPVLHLIPNPFPAVWHHLNDDGKHLDMPTVRDWARLVTAFVLEWLDLQEEEGQDS